MKNIVRNILARQSILAGLLAAIVAGICGGFHATPYNNYVLLADAFLHGRAWIAYPGAWIDALLYHGEHYIIEAPAPAIFLIPLVAFFGENTNQSLLGIVLCGVAVAAAWNIMENMRVISASRIAVAIAFFAGTDLFWCASLGDVWFLAHVSSVAMTMLALREVSAQRRPWLVALWACLAAESRFTMITVLPVYLALLILPAPLQHLKKVAPSFATVVAIFSFSWVAYNFIRWGLPIDIGYTTWYHQDSAGSPTGSPFALIYLPYELRAFFSALPTLQPTFPWIIAPLGGIALEVTSPALLIAFFARGDRLLLGAMWVAVILTAIPSLIYYVDGYAQFGMRHALDFEPFFMVLMAAAMRTKLRVWQGILCGYSAVVGTWGVWYWHVVMAR